MKNNTLYVCYFLGECAQDIVDVKENMENVKRPMIINDSMTF